MTDNTECHITRHNSDAYPLSLNQEQVWFECQLDPSSTLYNLGMRITLAGPLDQDVFLLALKETIERHETLKTVFAVIGDVPTQQVKRTLPVDCRVRQLAQPLPDDCEEESWSRIIHLAARPFDLSAGPLFRAELLRGPRNLHYFIFVFHHLILDEFYCGQVMQELVLTYFRILQHDPAPPSPQFQYGDFATWVQERWRSGAFDSSVQFWQEQLQEPLPRLHLPADRDIPPPWRVSSQVACCLDPKLVKRLRDLSRRHKTTLFRVIAAAIVAFFSRFSENDDLLVDIDFSVRPREMSRTVGFFANSLPVRFQIRPDETFDSLVHEVDRRLRNVSANREVPVRRLGRKFGLHHVNGRPLCSVMITQVGPLNWSVNELKLKGDAYVTATVHAMWLGVMERDDTVDLSIAYPDEVFNRERVEAWAVGIEQQLQLLSAAPHAPLLQVRGHPHHIQDSVLGAANLTTTELLRELEECP
jgi:hypothetical protein